MSDPVLQLREADPAAYARTPDAPPEDVLRSILTTPAERHRAPRRAGRAPRIVLAATALAAAAVVAFAALPTTENAPGPLRASLAERAYAATAPNADFITYTETTSVQSGIPGLESRDRLRQWQYRDRMHNFEGTVQPRGTWAYEHEQTGGTHRTLTTQGEVQVTKKTDPGWDPEELESGFKAGVTTLVERFREEIRRAEDLGETTFNGRRAHAYRVPEGEGRRRPPGEYVYYVDPDTALPLGSKITMTGFAPKVENGHPVPGEPLGALTVTTTVDAYQHLPVTPANLKLLDAPNIDAAQQKQK